MIQRILAALFGTPRPSATMQSAPVRSIPPAALKIEQKPMPSAITGHVGLTLTPGVYRQHVQATHEHTATLRRYCADDAGTPCLAVMHPEEGGFRITIGGDVVGTVLAKYAEYAAQNASGAIDVDALITRKPGKRHAYAVHLAVELSRPAPGTGAGLPSSMTLFPDPSRPTIGVTVTASVGRPEYDPNEDHYPEYPLHAVGESYYQDALRDIVENSGDPGPNWPYAGAQCEVMARLVPENGNPYDDQAVRVEIGGRKVGHLSRAEARRYRRMLATNAVTVKALIVGGWDHRNETYDRPRGSFGVRLAFKIEG